MKALVVIPVKNPRRDDFTDQLQALLAQDFGDYKILYLNSGSPWVKGELTKMSSEKILYREVEPEEFNHGLTRNMALSHLTPDTKYLAYLTHDSIPISNSWLRSLVAPMEKDSLCAFTFGQQYLLESSNVFEQHDLAQHFNNLSATGIAALGSVSWRQQRAPYRQRLHFNSNANSAYRANLLSQEGFTFADFGEDQLKAEHLVLSGLRGGYSEYAEVVHDNRLIGSEALRRAFDEARFFRLSFGYQLGGFFKLIVLLGLTLRSLIHIRSSKNERQAYYFYSTHKLLSGLGHMLGSCNFIPKPIINYFSRDALLKTRGNRKN